MVGECIVDALKVGSMTLFGYAITKAIGQKEISTIIKGVGIAVVGVDALTLVAPVCNTIVKVGNTLGKGVSALDHFGMIFDKIIHLGG